MAAKKKKRGSWSAKAPSKITERRKMPKSCFLDRKGLKYPICPRGTRGKQKVSCQGLEAAYKRARQQGKKKLAAKARRLQKRHGCKF